MMIFDEAARKYIREKILPTLTPIVVTSGICRYNFQCHYNVVHDAVSNGDDRVALCIYVDGNQPIIHFLNVRGDEFIDNTLGVWCRKYAFYLVRYIEKDYFFDVNDIFRVYRS